MNFVKGQTAMMVSGSLSKGQSTSDINVLWTDINGDGLSDRLDYNGTDVIANLNMGRKGIDDEITNWGNIQLARNTNNSDGGGLGVTRGKGLSISAGMSVGIGSSDSDRFLQDMNGDGLPDYCYSENNVLKVRYNLGDGFNPDSDCSEDFNMNRQSVSIDNGLNGSITLCIPFKIFAIDFKIPININGTVLSKSQNVVRKSIEDYDGDGYPDFVQQFEDCSLGLVVKHSKIRRTNKLKSISTPLGAQYTIDYKLAPPTYDMPNSKWVMSEVIIEDKHAEAIEGPATITKEFAYHNGKYDRRERDFYGFEYVRTIDRVTPGDHASSVYRQNVVHYQNRSYYLNGLELENSTIKGDVTISVDDLGRDVIGFPSGSIFNKIINTYEVRTPNISSDWIMGAVVLLGDEYDVGGTRGNGTAYVIKTGTTNEVYDLETTPISSSESMSYDDYGRVTSVAHNGSGNNYTSTISYYSPYYVPKILSIPNSITVIDNSGIRRKREVSSVNTTTGAIQEVRVFYGTGASDFNITTMTYDQYGNIKTVTHPMDQDGNARVQTYDYDGTLNQFIIKTIDAVGTEAFISEATYDYLYSQMLTSKDITGNVVEYTYDHQGRLEKVKGPYEQEYTLKFKYFVESNIKSYAITNHFDPQHIGNDMQTVTIVNGLGQPVQIKKDIEYYNIGNYTEARTLSGIVTKDKYGRAIKQYHPVLELGSNSFFNGNPSSYFSNETTYDELDRPLTVKDGENHQTTMSYDLANDAMHTTINVPQNGSVTIVKESFTDIDKRTIKQIDNNKATTFEYDGIGQLMNTIDEMTGLTTTSEYDFAGRRTKWTHPDAGENRYTYDKLGRMKTMQTANLIASSQDVKYKYDALGRIKSVTYPEYVGNIHNVNDLLYEYWPATPSGIDNNRGRLKLVEDGTGVRQYEYGPFGEIIKDTRTIIAPERPNQTFIHEFSYDTWNRIQSMTYPGGEVLNYSYDWGGNLKSMHSPSLNQSYISEIGYDEFEQKVFCKYGNNTTHHYSYTAELRRLNNMTAISSSSNEMFNNTYGFDYIGNIISIENMANPVGLMGGSYDHTYTYDIFNRLSTAIGSWEGASGQSSGNNTDAEYNTTLVYGDMHRINSKEQSHTRDQTTVANNTYNNIYEYSNNAHPNAVSKITNNITLDEELFTYDDNGNVLTHDNPVGENKEMLWDESNMLKAIKIADQSIQHYIYDANGERTLKGKGILEALGINGEIQSLTGNNTIGNYAVYSSPYFVIGSNDRVTLHYYSGSDRIVSRLAGASDIYNESGSELTGNNSGSLPTRQLADLQYVFTAFDLGTVDTENQPPVDGDCEAELNCPSQLYFFHPDHIGSSTFLTDEDGNPYQFLLYLPFGESMAEQKAGGYSTRYRFTGKEVDEETGLYYFGARYYDPRISLWYGVDPMTEEGPEYSAYIYSFNNPIMYIDANGEWPTPAQMKAFAKGAATGVIYGVVGGAAVAILIASGGTAAPALGYAMAAYGTYQAGKTGYEVASGNELWTGRELSSEERFEKGGELVGGMVGGGLGFKGAKALTGGKSPTSANSPNLKGNLREQYVANITGGKVAPKSGGKDFTISANINGNKISASIDVIGANGEYITVGGAAKANKIGSWGDHLNRLNQVAKVNGVQAKAFLNKNTPQNVIDLSIKILGKDNVKVIQMD